VVALVNEQGSQGEGRHEFETQEATIRNDVDGSLGVSRMLKTLADRERMPEWVVDRVRDLRRLRAEADPQGPLLTLPTEPNPPDRGSYWLHKLGRTARQVFCTGPAPSE